MQKNLKLRLDKPTQVSKVKKRIKKATKKSATHVSQHKGNKHEG